MRSEFLNTILRVRHAKMCGYFIPFASHNLLWFVIFFPCCQRLLSQIMSQLISMNGLTWCLGTSSKAKKQKRLTTFSIHSFMREVLVSSFFCAKPKFATPVMHVEGQELSGFSCQGVILVSMIPLRLLIVKTYLSSQRNLTNSELYVDEIYACTLCMLKFVQ